MKTNRLFNTIRNISWRVVVLLLTAIANLIIPRYIILIYGSEVNGLTTTITQVLNIVNLIQAGLGSSATYLMYKPIGERDRLALANIITSARRIYRYISLGISGVGIIASIAFALSVRTSLQREFILIASLITCIDSAASTYFTGVANIFLGAKQDGYLVSRITIIANVIGYILRILIIIFRPHYMTLYIVNMIVCMVNIIGLVRCFKKQYKPFEPNEDEQKLIHRIPIPGVSYAAVNEISHSLVNSAVAVVISIIAGIEFSSVFGVYMIAISVVGTISNAIYSAVVPSYGSVAAEENIENTNKIFEIYQFVLFSMNALMYMCAAYLMIPFVKLYTKGVVDAEYTNRLLMILMIVYGMSSMMRIPYNNTVYIRGLFKQTYLQPLICAVLAIGLMVVLTSISYTYTILGSIFFYLANTFYQHFKLPKLFEGFDNNRFWNHFAVIFCAISVAIAAYFIYPLSPNNYFMWFLDGCITGICSLLVLAVLILLIDRKSLVVTWGYFAARFRRKNNTLGGE